MQRNRSHRRKREKVANSTSVSSQQSPQFDRVRRQSSVDDSKSSEPDSRLNNDEEHLPESDNREEIIEKESSLNTHNRGLLEPVLELTLAEASKFETQEMIDSHESDMEETIHSEDKAAGSQDAEMYKESKVNYLVSLVAIW